MRTATFARVRDIDDKDVLDFIGFGDIGDIGDSVCQARGYTRGSFCCAVSEAQYKKLTRSVENECTLRIIEMPGLPHKVRIQEF